MKIFVMFSKRVAFILLFISIGVALFAYLYGKYQSYRISKFPEKLAYGTVSNINNPVLYINNFKYKNEYLSYVKVKENLKYPGTVSINFPLLYMPGGEKIYIRKYLEDSVLVEFFNPNSQQLFYGFKTGYLHRSYVHDTDTTLSSK